MDFANQLITVGGLLFMASILATVLTPRLGVPLLLVFLVIGMMAGEDGVGGILFDDYALANLATTAALAVILFDGGMRTRMSSFRVGLKPAVLLSTLGVLLTALVTGVFSAWLLGLSPAQGLLIGAIVGSTDAAAVFSLLHSYGLNLNQRVTAVLEIESGTNDPMAVFLTLALIQYLHTPAEFGLDETLLFLLRQAGFGALLGWAGGLLLVHAINRLALSEPLYPLLALFGGLLIYGGTSLLGGSGFLAAYLAGLIVGNRRTRAFGGIRRFHDGIAWLAQIGMFVMLGLLATPSRLVPVALPGLLIAAVLIFLARPLSVWLSLVPFRMPWREKVYIAWVGLRGSVPIVLATFPWLAGLPDAQLYFNIAFFIVLVSLLVQGWTVAPVAHWLGLQVPSPTDLVHRSEVDLPGQRGYEIVSYQLGTDSRLLGTKPKDLPLLDSSRIIAIARKQRLLPYREWGQLRAGDRVSVLTSEDALPALDELFRARRPTEEEAREAFFGEFHIAPAAPLSALRDLYGVPLPEGSETLSVAQAFARYMANCVVGDRLRLGEIDLVVRRMEGGRILEVGLRLPHE